MALRSFLAFDSSGLTIDGSSPSGTPGSSIVNNSDTPDGTIFEYNAGFASTITLDDTNDTNTFNDDDTSNHVITDGGGMVNNGTQVESESIIYLRALDAFGVETGPTITIVVFSQGGVTGDVWGFSSDTAMVPGTLYVKTGGSNAGDSLYSSYVTCFTKGTLLRTDQGTMRVEDIRCGQRIWTQSAGYQTVRWAHSTLVDGREDFAPIVFARGAIGNDKQIRVSPNHRMLVGNQTTEVLLGEDQVLVEAKHFVGLPGIRVKPCRLIMYYHFMFDRHQIVEANGVLTESFFPGPAAMSGLEKETRNELFALFPELKFGKYNRKNQTVAYVAKSYEAATLLDAAQNSPRPEYC